jgi:CheY-like chemotaxis protein
MIGFRPLSPAPSLPTSPTGGGSLRRISVLVVIVIGVLFWGTQTLDALRLGDELVREANAERLALVGNLQRFERSLDDLDDKVELTLSNGNTAAQTRLFVELQDLRTALWSRLDPLKPRIAKDPLRLEGVEVQLEGLGEQIGSLIKTFNKEGQSAALGLRSRDWLPEVQGVRVSFRQLTDTLHKEVEADWQATRMGQDQALQQLILGSALITAFALMWVGFLLTRSRGRQSDIIAEIDRLSHALNCEAGEGKAENRLATLLKTMKNAPVGSRFLNRLFTSSSLPCALLIEGKIHALSGQLDDLIGPKARTAQFAQVVAAFAGVDEYEVSDAVAKASGDWKVLQKRGNGDSAVELKVHALTASPLRYVELRDRSAELAAKNASAFVQEFADVHLLSATLEIGGIVISANSASCAYLDASETDLQMAHLTDFNLGVDIELLKTITGVLDKEGLWCGEVPIEYGGKPGLLLAQINKVHLAEEDKDVLQVTAIAQNELAQSRAAFAQIKAQFEGSAKKVNATKKRLAAERKRLTSEATGALQSFSQLLDLIAAFGREIRDPLNGALGLTELLASSGDAQRIDQLRNVNEQLTHLVYDLLDHGSLEAGNFDFDLQGVDLQRIARLVAARHARHLRGSDVRIDFIASEGELKTGFGDVTRVTQIVDSLVARATKYARPGGLIRLQTDNGNGDAPRLRVFDAGGEIPAFAEEEVFALASISGSPGSSRWSGMEPAVLRALAAGMQGELSAELLADEVAWSLVLRSAPEGSILPQSVSKGPLKEDESEELPPVINATVLVADDDEVNRLVASGLLERFGCAPLVVEDGEKAVAALQGYLEKGEPAPVELILLDLMMPRMGGLAATEIIRAGEAARGIKGAQRIPIVAVTARASDSDRQACLDAGMDAFISKPYRHEELEALVAQFAG